MCYHTTTHVPSTHLTQECRLKVDVDRGYCVANRYEQVTSTPPFSQVHRHALWASAPHRLDPEYVSLCLCKCLSV